MNLRWSDIDWAKNRFDVRSPKTEHHAGKESRAVPLFLELRTELETLRLCSANEVPEFVISRYRNPRENLGTPFKKIAKSAGLDGMIRPFDNMRMSRSNEVLREFGGDLESAWIGHSSAVRKQHYFMVNDADFERACELR